MPPLHNHTTWVYETPFGDVDDINVKRKEHFDSSTHKVQNSINNAVNEC